MPNVLVILGHPSSQSFSAALAAAYADAVEQRGARATRLSLAELTFDPVLHGAYHTEQRLEPDLVAARRAMVEADHIAWFFPMWWGGPPALVKGFVDRVFTPGFAFRYRGRYQVPTKLLSGRSARLVTSMDSPAFWYNVMLRRALHASFCVGTLGFVGIAPTRTTTLYEMRFHDAADRARALEQMRTAAERDLSKLRRAPGRALRLPALQRPQLLAEKFPDRSHPGDAP